MIMSFIMMVENQNEVKVKQIRTDSETKFRNSELESFCNEKEISQNFFSSYTPEQNGVAEKKNRTLIEAARTMSNGLVIFKHFWIEAVRISYYPLRIDQSLSKDMIRLLMRYSETESMISATPTRSLTELTQDNHVPKVITQNKQNIPYTEGIEGPPDLINTKGTQEQEVQNELINSQPTEESPGNNTETSVPITGSSVPESNPKESHLIVVKRILRYLKDRKITSGACQILGGKLVYWSAKKQQSVAMSSIEAEYVAIIRHCKNIIWMKSQLNDYDIHYKMVPIFYDNTHAIAISNNPFLHSRTKHIDIRYHFIRDHILKGDIELSASRYLHKAPG
nr:hypothetical protein [Tanacetum cinerariifolium]